jgi:hypothetical protein
MNHVWEVLCHLRSRLRILTVTAVVACSTGLAMLGGLALAQPAAASAYNCYGGYINANWAWGTCKGATNGWGGFSLTVQCYYWGANTVYGNAPQTIYASCPSWSHVTRIIVQPADF